MLKAYEIMIENGQIKWLKEQPIVKSARAILTLLEEDSVIAEKPDLFIDHEPTLEELGGSEPQAQEKPAKRGALGILKGKIKITDDFDDPLEDLKDYM
jgi:Protein of unknown function (DUF2281)